MEASIGSCLHFAPDIALNSMLAENGIINEERRHESHNDFEIQLSGDSEDIQMVDR